MFVISSLVNKQRNLSLVLFFIAVFFTGTVHWLNNFYLSQSAPELLRENITVKTSDDASYLGPAESWLVGNGWKTGQAGKTAIAGRSPAYGMMYAGLRSFLSEKAALKSLVILQIILFGFAVTLVPEIGRNLNMSPKLTAAIAICVAVMPTFSGFLSYTLTEAITPSLVLIFLYTLLRFSSQPNIRGVTLAVILGLLILVRPPMIVWVLPILMLGFSPVMNMRFKKVFALLVIALIPILSWQVYISIKTERWQSLHPIYQDDANDLYRPLHHDIWNFHKSWGQTGSDFNNNVNALWADALHQRSGEPGVSNIMSGLSPEVIETIGYGELENAYLEYFEILQKQVPYSKDVLTIPGMTDSEKELSSRFVKYRKAFVREYPLYSYVVIPFKVYFNLGAHSNLSLYLFQKTWRGTPFMEILRYFSFALHLGVFIFFPIAFLFMRKSLLWLCVSTPILVYLMYLCVVQRGVEERYTLPVLVPMFLLVTAAGSKLVRDFQQVVSKR